MPTYKQHCAFVRSKPYRLWFLIKVGAEYVGDIHVTKLNEIGVFLFERHRGKGYGAKALGIFLGRHRPLPAIPAVRVRAWLANIAPENGIGEVFFGKQGFRPVQRTWQLDVR